MSRLTLGGDKLGKRKFYLVLLICFLGVLMSGCAMKTNQANVANAEKLSEKEAVNEDKKEAVQEMKDIKIADSKEKSSDTIKETSTEKASNTSPSKTQTVVRTPSTDSSASSVPKVIDKTIYIGTTKEEVSRKIDGYCFFEDFGAILEGKYLDSTLYFSKDNGQAKVIGWDNSRNNLKVSAGEKVPTAPAFTLGSSEADVIRAMGTPDCYGIPYYQDAYTCKFSLNSTGEFEWRYGYDSSITFNKSLKVIAWYTYNKSDSLLKVSYGSKVASAPPIKLGSSLEDIIKAYGTPMTLSTYNEGLRYKPVGYNNCMFTLDQNDKVIGWTNMGSDKVYIGSKEPFAPPISYNSTVQEVVSALGTPDKIEFTYKWYYGDSSITFNNNWVVSSIVNIGNIPLK